MSKARRKGKIFIDWLRNQRGATAGAELTPLAVPITLDELQSTGKALSFTINDAPALAKRAASSFFKGWGFAAPMLPSV